jgi:uncharacterized membrane protein
MELRPVWLSKLFLKNQKCLKKYLSKLFCFRGFHKTVIFNELSMIIWVYNSRFIKKIYRAAEKSHSLPPLHTVLCRRWGRSGSFQPKAVSLVMVLKQCGLGKFRTLLILNFTVENGLITVYLLFAQQIVFFIFKFTNCLTMPCKGLKKDDFFVGN